MSGRESITYTVTIILWESFVGENFHEFRDFRIIHESFICEISELGVGLNKGVSIRKSFIRENHNFNNL